MVLDVLARAAAASDALAELSREVARSVVLVRGSRGSAGSGVIWDRPGLVITNHHVVHGAQAELQLADGRRVLGRVVRRAPGLDLAALEVEDDLAPGLPPIQGNTGRLQQVFLNLFLNAKDAMPGGGTLKVHTANGNGVRVTVADSGTGIAQEHIHRIYDPFFTTKTTSNNGQKRGTGLGLSVTYGIIQEHAGQIHVESRPGEGTTFYVDFPLTRKAVNV